MVAETIQEKEKERIAAEKKAQKILEIMVY